MRLLHFVRNDAMFCKCAGYKNRDAKNHRRVARGTTQKTEAFFENTALPKYYFVFKKIWVLGCGELIVPSVFLVL